MIDCNQDLPKLQLRKMIFNYVILKMKTQITEPNQPIVFTNNVAADENYKLSIVSPVYKNDPSALLIALKNEAAKLSNSAQIEIIIVDDGSNIVSLTALMRAQISEFTISARLYSFEKNNGRSFARNHLIQSARGEYLLFLDSDMLPDSPDFLKHWCEFIDKTAPTIAYGGFTMLQASKDAKFALARALASRIDCLNAKERTIRGPLAVATSNLLVRKDIMEHVPFDNGFVGWGWEDVDWALRANAADYAVVHVEIPATHLGLDEDKVILEKFARAGPNFRHITERHKEMELLSTTKIARLIAKVPFLKAIAKIIYKIATNVKFPLEIRSRCARLYRAIWAAISLKS